MDEQPAAGPGPNRRVVLGAIGALVVSTQVGRAFLPVLVAEAPLLLLVLSPLPAHMVLVAPITEPVPFVLVAGARRLLGATAGYYFGMIFAAQGLSWLEAKTRRTARAVRLLQRAFERFPYATIVLLPNLGTPLLAGHARLPLVRFVLADAVGQVLAASVLYFLGDALSVFIEPIIAFIREHVLGITACTVSVVALWQLIQRRRRRSPAEPPNFG